MSQKRRELGSIGAVWNAFRGADISYYPRTIDSQTGEPRTLPIPQIVEDIKEVLSMLDEDIPEDVQRYLDRGRESLDEVKGLTEYQDQKATRLLTIIAFLSALSGALFAKFMDLYPLHTGPFRFPPCWRTCLVLSTYSLFAVFILSAISGALVIFHATRTNFKYPKAHPLDKHTESAGNGSYLFYSDIVSMRPAEWAQSFLCSRGFVRDGGQRESYGLATELPTRYLKNYVLESYLVACKIADKLRYLQPAQSILSFSIRVLFLWVIFISSTWIFVPPAKSVPPTAPRSSVAPLRISPTQTADDPARRLAVR
ncbi:MAG TPA: hypothetical protein VFI05_07260 [Nitrospiraceae bacterium]|nr:hypothetical protein [Nitrospiraceae bacterium]